MRALRHLCLLCFLAGFLAGCASGPRGAELPPLPESRPVDAEGEPPPVGEEEMPVSAELPPPPPGEEAPEDRLILASRRAIEAREWERALRRARQAVERARVSPSRPYALDHLGEALFHVDRFGEADDVFSEIVSEHPDYPRVGRVIRRRFQIGAAMVQGHRGRDSSPDRGAEILRTLLERFTGAEFDFGRLLLGDYWFDEGRSADAREEYERLIEDFPDSVWVPAARYRIALTYLAESFGIDHDPSPLLEAERRLEAYVRDHPSGAHAEEARSTLDRLRASLARRDLEIARSYLSVHGRPLAAIVYAGSVLRRRPGAPAASGARRLLEGLSEHEDEEVAEAATEALESEGS